MLVLQVLGYHLGFRPKCDKCGSCELSHKDTVCCLVQGMVAWSMWTTGALNTRNVQVSSGSFMAAQLKGVVSCMLSDVVTCLHGISCLGAPTINKYAQVITVGQHTMSQSASPVPLSRAHTEFPLLMSILLQIFLEICQLQLAHVALPASNNARSADFSAYYFY